MSEIGFSMGQWHATTLPTTTTTTSMRDFLATLYELHLTAVPGLWRLRQAVMRRRGPRIPAEVLANGRLLNLGCGRSKLPGFVNVDGLAERAPDVVSTADRLAFAKDGEFDLVRASHLLEHFAPDELDRVLGEWRRVLKPGGLLVVCVPDHLRLSWRAILQPSALDPDSPAGRRSFRDQVSGFFALDLPAEFRHKMMFTARGLRRCLERNGFQVLHRLAWPAEIPHTLGVQDDSCSTFSLNLLARRRD